MHQRPVPYMRESSLRYYRSYVYVLYRILRKGAIHFAPSHHGRFPDPAPRCHLFNSHYFGHDVHAGCPPSCSITLVHCGIATILSVVRFGGSEHQHVSSLGSPSRPCQCAPRALLQSASRSHRTCMLLGGPMLSVRRAVPL